MLKNFPGFDLVYKMQELRRKNKLAPSLLKKKALSLIFIAASVSVLWFLPTESFGIDGLTAVQQRIIAIFVYATLMWVLELVPAWATSVSIIVLLLLFTSDSGIKWICDPRHHQNRTGRTPGACSAYTVREEERKHPSGFHAGNRPFLHVHQQHGHYGHDAHLPHARVQAASRGR